MLFGIFQRVNVTFETFQTQYYGYCGYMKMGRVLRNELPDHELLTRLLPNPVHGFSPSFQEMFTTRGARTG